MSRRFTIGSVFLGLVWVVLFLVAAPANAGIVRGDEVEGLKPVGSWSWYYNENKGGWHGGGKPVNLPGGNGSGGSSSSYVIKAVPKQNQVTFSGNVATADRLVQGGYALSITPYEDGGDPLNFLDTMSVKLFYGDVEQRSLPIVSAMGGYDDGNYFYHFASLLGDVSSLGDDNWSLVFNFDNSDKQGYTFSLLDVGNPDLVPVAIPEPTTLAILGFGLAGLGLARRRMK